MRLTIFICALASSLSGSILLTGEPAVCMCVDDVPFLPRSCAMPDRNLPGAWPPSWLFCSAAQFAAASAAALKMESRYVLASTTTPVSPQTCMHGDCGISMPLRQLLCRSFMPCTQQMRHSLGAVCFLLRLIERCEFGGKPGAARQATQPQSPCQWSWRCTSSSPALGHPAGPVHTNPESVKTQRQEIEILSYMRPRRERDNRWKLAGTADVC